MLEVSALALERLKAYLHEQQLDPSVRIAVMGGSCIGPSLRFTVDEQKKDDLVEFRDDIVFFLDRELAAVCGSIRIDFAPKLDGCPCSGHNGGFSISCEAFPGCRNACHAAQGNCCCQQASSDASSIPGIGRACLPE